MKKCLYCGSVLADTAKFCNICGSPLSDETHGSSAANPMGHENPYEKTNPQGNPYANPQSNPYTNPQQENPYANPQGNPYANQNGNPYANQPQSSAEISTSAKATGIIGMILGIFGILGALIFTFTNLSVLFLSELIISAISLPFVNIFGIMLVLLIPMFLFAIVGGASVVLGNISIKKGNYGVIPKASKILGIITLFCVGICIVMMLIMQRLFL